MPASPPASSTFVGFTVARTASGRWAAIVVGADGAPASVVGVDVPATVVVVATAAPVGVVSGEWSSAASGTIVASPEGRSLRPGRGSEDTSGTSGANGLAHAAVATT